MRADLDTLAYFGQYLWVGPATHRADGGGGALDHAHKPGHHFSRPHRAHEDNASLRPAFLQAFICERNSQPDRFAIYPRRRGKRGFPPRSVHDP